jgi:hypothetical protein
MSKASIIFTLCVIGVSVLLIWYIRLQQAEAPKQEEVVSVPETPREENKSVITYVNASSDMIQVELPFPDAVTGKEFGIIGKARGYWFFEGSFPVEVRDKDGVVLASGIATALGEWMTEDFVRFVSEVKVPETYIGPATVILKKDNPSGEPQNDALISFPITVEK